MTDRAGALAALDCCAANLRRVESVLVDGGYTGEPFAQGVEERLGATVQVVKRDHLHTFVVLPKRGVVERSFAWLEKCRRLWKNCEPKLNTSLSSSISPPSGSYSEDLEQVLKADGRNLPQDSKSRLFLSGN